MSTQPGSSTGSFPKFHPTAALGSTKGLVKAAEDGDADAMIKLARFYWEGENGFPHDRGAASHWYELAARAGHPEGMYQLAEILRWGEGRVPDKAAAEQWYRAAAERGHEKARNWLVHAYHTGDGTVKDHQAAVHYNHLDARPKVPLILWAILALVAATLAFVMWKLRGA